MVEDKIIWNGVKQRITSKMSSEDFKIMCRLHSKYLNNNKYHEPCTCNKRIVRKWIEQLNNELL